VSSAWLRADGGFICADAPNAGTSAAVIVPPISTPRDILPKRVTRLSRASSPASIGFTTIVQNNPSLVPSFTLLTRILLISLCPDRPGRCRQIGKRKFANRIGTLSQRRSNRGRAESDVGSEDAQIRSRSHAGGKRRAESALFEGVSLIRFDIVKISPAACLFHHVVPCGELAAGLRVIVAYFSDLFPRGWRTRTRIFFGMGSGEPRRETVIMSSPP
jgi:hypothetical protein